MENKLAPHFEYLDNPTLMSISCSITETNNSTSVCRKQFERKYLPSSCSSLLEASFPSFPFLLSLLINPQRRVETCKYMSYKNTANFCTKNQKWKKGLTFEFEFVLSFPTSKIVLLRHFTLTESPPGFSFAFPPLKPCDLEISEYEKHGSKSGLGLGRVGSDIWPMGSSPRDYYHENHMKMLITFEWLKPDNQLVIMCDGWK